VDAINAINAVISGLLSGLSLGLTGSGGSVLAVPLLVYFVGLNPHTAVGTSLVAVGITAIIGFSMHWRKGNIDFKTGTLMALTSINRGFCWGARGEIAFLQGVKGSFCWNSYLGGPVLNVDQSTKGDMSLPAGS
jgi:hypothetical protein